MRCYWKDGIMTQIAKLYAALLANPRARISFRDFERLLRAAGFRLDRTKGSHRHYVHDAVPWILTVLPEGKGARSIRSADFSI
jgi:predicted RNA binding protein YcfA (HicA-like mRNA interferase family)